MLIEKHNKKINVCQLHNIHTYNGNTNTHRGRKMTLENESIEEEHSLPEGIF